uniref:Rad60/SUMO-like domain-containing protein n=1 Tax=Pithovirus LCDPAC02 TaxID=2506601 RepID=A0A481YQY8_9VIRU|nr:MAG: hypothetical protein LCDPAC02_00450 [Pithovirus LCDPAC02]
MILWIDKKMKRTVIIMRDNRKVYFSINENSKIKKMMMVYCQRLGLYRNKMSFYLNDKYLYPNDIIGELSKQNTIYINAKYEINQYYIDLENKCKEMYDTMIELGRKLQNPEQRTSFLDNIDYSINKIYSMNF